MWTAIREFVVVFVDLLRWVWDLLEPFLELKDNQSRLIAFLALALLSFILLKARRRPVEPAPDTSYSLLGSNPSLITICEHLEGLLKRYTTELNIPPQMLAQASSTASDLKEGRLRLYIIGHQNSGKSSLINTLIGAALSPVSSGKLTACLVRVRQGDRLHATIHWKSEVREEIKVLSLEKRMEAWSKSSEIPKEVVIETPRKILGIEKLELIDSPGTGSEWNVEFRVSLEDELVSTALRSAAVAILVYRYSTAEMEAHASLLRQLATNQVPTFAICNLDPNWAEEYRSDYAKLERTISAAESKLRETTRARCYRLAVRDTPIVSEVAKTAGVHSLEDLRADLEAMLRDKSALLKRQAVVGCRLIIDNVSSLVVDHMKRLAPFLEKVDGERNLILAAVASVRAILTERIRGYSGTAIGATGGGAVGTVAAVGAAAAAGGTLTVATGGLFLAVLAVGAAAGAGVGYVVDLGKRWRFKKRLGAVWDNLHNACASASIVHRALIKRISALSAALPEEQCLAVTDEVEHDMQARLQEIQEYRTYAACKVVEKDLKEVKAALARFGP